MSFTRRPLVNRLVNPVGLGCMSLAHAYGTPPPPEESVRLLHQAIDLGYDHFDTARVYGLGKSEAIVGEALKGRRDKVLLATKTGIFTRDGARVIDCRPETIRTAVEDSLRTLQTDFIDLYYLHRRDFTVPIEESVGALADLVRAGKIGGIGLSEMSADTLRRAAAVHPIAAMQTEYSLCTRNAEIAVLDACRELGTTFVAFSPVGRGWLAGAVDDPETLTSKDLRRSLPRFAGDNWRHNKGLLESLRALAAEQGVTPAQLSLAWVLSRGNHVVSIPGTASSSHLAENIARWDWQPVSPLLERIGSLISDSTTAGRRYPADLQVTIDTEEFA